MNPTPTLNVRLTEEEEAIISQHSRQYGISKSELVRALIDKLKGYQDVNFIFNAKIKLDTFYIRLSFNELCTPFGFFIRNLHDDVQPANSEGIFTYYATVNLGIYETTRDERIKQVIDLAKEYREIDIILCFSGNVLSQTDEFTWGPIFSPARAFADCRALTTLNIIRPEND